MLEPKKLKYRRQFKGKNRGKAQRGNKVSFGEYGLKALTHGHVTAREIEAARKAIRGYVKRGGKMWIRIFPDVPVTQKPAEVRMGSGKGPFDHYVVKIKPGKVMFEMSGVTEEIAKEAMRRGAHKLRVRTQFVVREA
ncbi:50S ribosomal protein L16 [bacterium]|uniref:Large ribosomal subunit protein uL16 n=2 Tax=Katanobacteria TaxID=422282 RepID=A0A2M7X327_UNCKA|nr:50S ribosomal protein L16 [bacterium]PIP56913.1 MAG: 50S ribosomal protein L16 [candidate division WWE3 bacterium CG22_combo_CG10-13_8_21_14_all_39_12]PJA40557.1 MAG: 50S ribosomal protein L16 [candidate division WWE3 bacterium CG_4_9_14_3_um_filter_39_7]